MNEQNGHCEIFEKFKFATNSLTSYNSPNVTISHFDGVTFAHFLQIIALNWHFECLFQFYFTQLTPQ